MPLELSIVTPEQAVVAGAVVDEIVAPGREGEFGVLPAHEPFLAPLRPGIVRYRDDGGLHRVAVSGGFAEVTAERVTILARTAEPAGEIDRDRAVAARDRARVELEELGTLSPGYELERARDELARAEARIEALEQAQ